MNRLKIGVRLESLGLPLRRALAEASKMGATGVQVDAVGDLSPKALSETGRREFRNLLRAYNLELTAVGCPLRRGLDDAEGQQPRVEHVRKVMSLSFDLGPRVTVVEAGQVPEKEDEPRARLLREALADLGRHGDRVGAALALATGLEAGEVLAGYLATFDTGSLAANLDPGNLLLHGFDPRAAVGALRGKIAHTYAKDARRGGASRAAREVPLGHGDVDWLTYLAALEEAEYRGWVTVEREGGDDRAGDVARGVEFLRRLVG